MPIRFLKTLIAISEKGNFSDAADKVCVTPAAVSQQMKRLEEMLNLDLFDRNKRTPELTITGKKLIPRAREIIHAYESMVSDLQNESPMSGEFIVGAVSSSFSTLLPMSIKSLLQTYPDIHIRIVTAPSHDLLPQLDRGAIDAAIMSKPQILSSHFHWQTFAEEEMVVICSKELTPSITPLKKNTESQLPFDVLRSHPYIRMPRQSTVGIMADRILKDANIDITDSMELGSLDNIARMVSHNLGVALIPKPCIMDTCYESLNIIPISQHSSPRIMGILSRHDSSKGNLTNALLETIINTITLSSLAIIES